MKNTALWVQTGSSECPLACLCLKLQTCLPIPLKCIFFLITCTTSSIRCAVCSLVPQQPHSNETERPFLNQTLSCYEIWKSWKKEPRTLGQYSLSPEETATVAPVSVDSYQQIPFLLKIIVCSDVRLLQHFTFKEHICHFPTINTLRPVSCTCSHTDFFFFPLTVWTLITHFPSRIIGFGWYFICTTSARNSNRREVGRRVVSIRPNIKVFSCLMQRNNYN